MRLNTPSVCRPTDFHQSTYTIFSSTNVDHSVTTEAFEDEHEIKEKRRRKQQIRFFLEMGNRGLKLPTAGGEGPRVVAHWQPYSVGCQHFVQTLKSPYWFTSSVGSRSPGEPGYAQLLVPLDPRTAESRLHSLFHHNVSKRKTPPKSLDTSTFLSSRSWF